MATAIFMGASVRCSVNAPPHTHIMRPQIRSRGDVMIVERYAKMMRVGRL
jgi:hypothetical protein